MADEAMEDEGFAQDADVVSCLRLTTTNLLQRLLLQLRASLRLPVLMEIHRKSLKPNQKN